MTLPPLRQRKEDIPLLADAFIAEFAAKYDRPAKSISADALEILQQHAWPGNVRELRNCLERAVIGSYGHQISAAVLPLAFRPVPTPAPPGVAGAPAPPPPGMTLDEAERILILRTLTALGNNKTRAAESLGISLKTLHNKLRRYSAS
jgi:DNA-binding NtrC family response regulator